MPTPINLKKIITNFLYSSYDSYEGSLIKLNKFYNMQNCKTMHMSPNNNAYIMNSDKNNMSHFPIGMSYVPWQNWNKIYRSDIAIDRGTIFQELDLPFLGQEVI